MDVRSRTTRQVLTRRTFAGVVVSIASLVLVEASENFPTHLSFRGRALAMLVWIAAGTWVFLTPCLACGRALRWQAFNWAFGRQRRSRSCPRCGVSIDDAGRIKP